jgi:hypothetical protein
MANKPLYFKLEFIEAAPNSPMTPEVEIHARHNGTYQRMTPKITEAEFDGYIDALIEQLEDIRREGNRKFATTRDWRRRE